MVGRGAPLDAGSTFESRFPTDEEGVPGRIWRSASRPKWCSSMFVLGAVSSSMNLLHEDIKRAALHSRLEIAWVAARWRGTEARTSDESAHARLRGLSPGGCGCVRPPLRGRV